MTPVNFKLSNNTLQPSNKSYSDDIEGVDPLPIWSNGEQCVSKWKLSWLERFRVLIFGHVWVSVLSGWTQPPIIVDVHKEYLTAEEK